MPGPYRLEVTPAAARDLKALARRQPDQKILGKIDRAILALATDPRPNGSVKLQGSELRRIVVDDYRVIYDVQDDPAVVAIARVRHRRDAYRDH